jgi:hypothetical protein
VPDPRAGGRPVILSPPRSPLSNLRSFGAEWYAVSQAPLPTVALSGSLLGWIDRAAAERQTAEVAHLRARISDVFDLPGT